jgi:NTE family protein
MNDNQREMLVSCLTQVFGRIEDSVVDAIVPMLRWIELSGGETLFRQGDVQDGVYLVISGRLRALQRENETDRIVAEIGQGQTVGEAAVLMREPYADFTVHAVRDSVLAHVSRESFDELTWRHPQLPVHVARVVIERLRRSGPTDKPTRPKTICLIAITDGVDISQFGEQLASHIERWGVVRLETARSIDERFGSGTAQCSPDDAEQHHKLTMWLDDLEFWHEYVVFAADPEDSPWTQRCIRHADLVLLLARADAAPAIHPLEERYLSGPNGVASEQMLVLLHSEATPRPVATSLWLDRRPVHRHIHVRPALARDTARLARIVSGNAVGLVLAGGGARGFAHLGAYKALQEAGIAIDLVGGTSIGAMMGGYISLDRPAGFIIDCARRIFESGPTSDVNILPLISLLRGRRLKRASVRAVRDAYDFDADAADTWRNFFCIATNWSRASETVLSRGDLGKIILASLSIPVALPPVILDGELLVDGGTFNNFPVDTMRNLGAARIIGIDLGRPRRRVYEFDEVPSPWALLMDRLRPRSRRRYRLPGLGAMLMETTIMYSTSRQAAARQGVDLYVNPDLGRVGMLEWKAFDKIVAAGYQEMRTVLESLPAETLALYRDELESPAVLSEKRRASAL